MIPSQSGGIPASRGSATFCPVCHKDDQVTRISSFVDASTQLTTGSARSLGGGMVAGRAALGGGVTRSSHVTESVLVQRLAPPPQPKGRGCLAAFLITPGAFFGLFAVVTLSGGDLGAFVRFVIFGAIAAAWIYAVWRWVLAPVEVKRKLWRQGLLELRSGYFCMRDDVAFEYANPSAYTSEAFVRMIFQRQTRNAP